MSTAAAEIMTVAMRRQRRGVAVLWAFGGPAGSGLPALCRVGRGDHFAGASSRHRR